MPPDPVPHYLKSKQHYHLLDGLRGIAAVSVVVFHFCEWINTDFKENFIGHGFLAVDFFFCLSGFVMGYAYDNRVKKMGIITFLKTRFIRLHPMVVLGTILGLLGLLLDPFVNTIAYSPTKLFVIFMASNLRIPLPIL